MNTEKAQQAINQLVAEVANNRQYPTSKAQDEQLKLLGIYDMMPKTQVKNGRRFIGYTDAAVVISAATNEFLAVGTYSSMDDTTAAVVSDLYAALNEKPAPEPQPAPVVEAAPVATVRSFVNTSERYGNAERCTIAQYRDLNPDGEFYETGEGIFEVIDGRSEQIAESVVENETGAA